MAKMKPRLIPATVVRYPDGRLRGLALSDEDWTRFQFKVGDHVIVEMAGDEIAAGSIVLRAGLKMVRAAVGEREARSPIFVRRPQR